MYNKYIQNSCLPFKGEADLSNLASYNEYENLSLENYFSPYLHRFTRGLETSKKGCTAWLMSPDIRTISLLLLE